jgi:hypothetical protein
MTQFPETPPPDWDLGNWEESLTIHVGTVHVCRQCENIVMVTRGGVGILELNCCGKPMEQVAPSDAGRGGQD